MTKPKVGSLLVIDDDPLILQVMTLCLPSPDYQIVTASSAEEGLKLFQANDVDAVLMDIQLPKQSGLGALSEIRELDRRIPVILMTGHGTAESAIQAMSGGAYEYVTKPFEPDEILPLIDSAIETSQMARRPTTLTSEPDEGLEGDQILGSCPAMIDVFRSIGRVAQRDVAVLILGETGTGKEVVARAIYQHSRRQDQVFHAINCAAIPENLLESELFGHEKGSFTGADQRRIGKFEQCNGGTLFLDEIGDMSPLMQTKLLRVLQDKQFERVGGNKTLKTDVRIIAATNRDLEAAMNDKTFRSDLFYRLNEFNIQLPPLRERGGDVATMARHFFRTQSKILGIDFDEVTDEALLAIARYSWPGNVRELQGVVKQTLLKSTGPVITPAFLPPAVKSDRSATEPANQEQDASWTVGLRQEVNELLASGAQEIQGTVHDKIDRLLIESAIKYCRGNLTAACSRLGVSRPTLRNRIKQLGIDASKVEN